MHRSWLKSSEGDALHVVLCAAGLNIWWLLRAIARKPGKVASLAFNLVALHSGIALAAAMRALASASTVAVTLRAT
jgi:IS5 family transposase